MSRRRIHWHQVRGFRGYSCLAIATALGAGLAPILPGTAGTAVAVPLAYWSADWSLLARLLLWLGLLAAGTWAARVFDQIMGASDHQSIVIDEVVGFGISAWTAGTDPRALATAFVLFRFFDMLKPPPVRQADQLSKNWMRNHPSSPWGPWVQGFGVMLDDVLAGFLTLAVMVLLQSQGWIPN